MLQLSPAGNAPAKHSPVVRVCGRPINIVQEAASFDMDVVQWTGFAKKHQGLFHWSGIIPDGWKTKPIPHPNSSKLVSVIGTLDGVRVAGTSKRFQVEISSVVFLGSALAGSSAQGRFSDIHVMFWLTFSAWQRWPQPPGGRGRPGYLLKTFPLRPRSLMPELSMLCSGL